MKEVAGKRQLSQHFVTHHHQVCEQLVQLVKVRAGIAAPVVQAVSLGGQSFASG